MRTQRLFAYAFAVCLVSLLAGPAMAEVGSGNFNAFLQGQYQVNGTVTCATGMLLKQLGPGRLCSTPLLGSSPTMATVTPR